MKGFVDFVFHWSICLFFPSKSCIGRGGEFISGNYGTIGCISSLALAVVQIRVSYRETDYYWVTNQSGFRHNSNQELIQNRE